MPSVDQTIPDETRKDQEALASYFDKSVSAVRKYADGFERFYARPAIESFLAVFKEHPTLSTFSAIFLMLSFAPFICFIAFSVFAIISIFCLVLFSSFIMIALVEASLAFLLAMVLTAILLVSVPLTVFAISTYLLARFIVLIRTEGREGVSKWTGETKRHFIQSKTSERKVGRDRSDTGSEASSASGVMVKVKDYEQDSVGFENTKAVEGDKL